MAFQQQGMAKGHDRGIYISTVKGHRLTVEPSLSVSFPRQPVEGSMMAELVQMPLPRISDCLQQPLIR
jgi:hypothetical protein